MTDNQFDQLFGLVTKSVTGVQRLVEKVDKLEAGQIKIEERTGKIENEMKILNKTFSIV